MHRCGRKHKTLLQKIHSSSFFFSFTRYFCRRIFQLHQQFFWRNFLAVAKPSLARTHLVVKTPFCKLQRGSRSSPATYLPTWLTLARRRRCRGIVELWWLLKWVKKSQASSPPFFHSEGPWSYRQTRPCTRLLFTCRPFVRNILHNFRDPPRSSKNRVCFFFFLKYLCTDEQRDSKVIEFPALSW